MKIFQATRNKGFKMVTCAHHMIQAKIKIIILLKLIAKTLILIYINRNKNLQTRKNKIFNFNKMEIFKMTS